MTDRDYRFADEYFVDYDAKNAAIRAGYSVATAKNAANWINVNNPTKPKLRELIDRRAAEISRRCGISAERVMNELAKIAFADITDIVDPKTGGLLEGVSRSDAAAVVSIHVKNGDDFVEREVRMYDKVKALELIGKRLNLFSEEVKLSGPVPVIIDDVYGAAQSTER